MRRAYFTLPQVNPQELMRPWLDATLTAVPEPDIFDAHTHTGSNDPDGMKASLEEVPEMLDPVGARGAVVFTMHEPDGYPEANDRVLAEAERSGGRLVPFCRVNPHHDAPRQGRGAPPRRGRG